MYYFQFCLLLHLTSVYQKKMKRVWSVTCAYLITAEAGRSSMYEARHDPGDSPQLEGLQTQQAADAEGGTHDWEAGETAEVGAGEETQTETSGEPH